MRSLHTMIGSAILAAMLSTSASHADTEHTGARSSAERAIRDLVAQTVAAAAQGDMERYLRFYDPKAALVLPGLPIQYGVGAPRKNGFPKGYAIAMVTVKVEVAKSGDMAYAFGTYEQTAPDAHSGALTNTTGKWMSVFRRQPDGSWGAIADTYNVDPPAKADLPSR